MMSLHLFASLNVPFIKQKKLDKRYRNDILEYLVPWRGYRKDFVSWVPAAIMKNILEGMVSSFYVTLLSNFSMKSYPVNKISAFTVQLPHEIGLGEIAGKVALCKFHAPT